MNGRIIPCLDYLLVLRIREPFYLTFDTTLSCGYPAYSWVSAVEFEKTSSLDFMPPVEFVPMVLAKAQACVEQQVPYSVLT